MGRMVVQILPGDPERPATYNFADGDVQMVLEGIARELLQAESALRTAETKWTHVLASCRKNGQAVQAEAALKGLDERRRGAI
jgi:hypothetical protein